MALATHPSVGRGSRPLGPRRSEWFGRALGCAAVGLAGFGAAPLAGYDELGTVSLGVGAAGVGACTAFGVRAHRRGLLLDQIATALAPAQGFGMPVRESITLGRWQSGTPTRVVVTYAPGVDTALPEWRVKLRRPLARLTGLEFKISRHDERRCRVVLQANPAEVAAATTPEIQRAKSLTTRLFGESAEIDLELDGSELRRLRVQHDLGPKVARAQVRKGIENGLTAMLPGRWRSRWELTNDVVVFEQRPAMPTAVPHIAGPVDGEHRFRIPLAIDEDGRSVTWDLKGSGPHLLVVGKTGTGKTVAINGVVMDAARRDWRVWVCDPKRIEFMGLRDWPNVQLVATAVEDMIATIKHAHDLMEERYEAIEKRGAREADFEPLVLVLDEFRNFHRLVTAWYSTVKYKGLPSKCPVFDWVAAIAEKGRSGRVHLVLGTQRPDADFLTGSMRDNFDSRLALGRLSPQGAQMMWESPYLGVAVPRKIPGRGTGITEDERVDEVQVLWTPDPRRAYDEDKKSDIALLEALRPERAVHHPLEVDLGDEVTIDGDARLEWDKVIESDLVAAGTATPRPVHKLDETLGLEPSASAPAVEEAPLPELEEFDPFEGYAPASSTSVSGIEAGDLICIDEDLGVWVVVEAVDEVDADDYIAIGWRDDEGDSGEHSLCSSDQVAVRRPLVDEDAS